VAGARWQGHDTHEDEPDGPAVTGDICRPIGTRAVAMSVWRRTLAILEELHDFGADEARPGLALRRGASLQRMLSGAHSRAGR
jgi:hypothetical protein